MVRVKAQGSDISSWLTLDSMEAFFCLRSLILQVLMMMLLYHDLVRIK